MEAKKDSEGKPLKSDKYKKENGKFTKDAIFTYLYEQTLGKNHEFDTQQKDDQETQAKPL